MIKNIFGTKNKKSGNFNMPQFYDFPKENATEVFTISVKEAPKEQSEALKELELYYLGCFDTKTGEFISLKEYLLDLGSVVDGKEE